MMISVKEKIWVEILDEKWEKVHWCIIGTTHRESWSDVDSRIWDRVYWQIYVIVWHELVSNTYLYLPDRSNAIWFVGTSE